MLQLYLQISKRFLMINRIIFLLLLQYDTKYNYEVGIGNTTRQFWFVTPPKVGPDVPYTFGLIGTFQNYGN